MKNIRIISRLDIKGPNVVKGIHLEGLRVVGNPSDFAKFYYESGADELLYMDVVASLYNRNSLKDVVERTASDIFIPLTVGGGIRSLSDISNVLRSGADKISLNTAAIRNPELVKIASEKFGSSTIMVSIEAIKQNSNSYQVFVDNGREFTGKDVVEWAQEVQFLGAGEILVTSVDREGTGTGFDIDLIKMVTNSVSIPVIAHGGAGSMSDVKELINQTNVDAVALASSLHYSTINQIKDTNVMATNEGNKDFLKSGKTFSKIQPFTIGELKSFLIENNIKLRYE